MQTSRYPKVLPNVISFIENIKDTCCLRAFVCIVILTIACMRGCRHFRLGKWGWGGGGADNVFSVQLLFEGVGTSISMETYTKCQNVHVASCFFQGDGGGRPEPCVPPLEPNLAL